MKWTREDDMSFIVIKDGKEVDWIDWVLDVIVDDKSIMVYNFYLPNEPFIYPLGTEYTIGKWVGESDDQIH